MAIKIDSKIVSCSVVTKENLTSDSLESPAQPAQIQKTEMSEKIARPESLSGKTYKIDKSPSSEHALYVTINDIILDEGTPHETRRPFEIFINSKNMDQFQWIVAMTRILSAVFRKGGDVTFVVEEMKSVFDPHGGYFRPGGGGYVPSLIAEIGYIVEKHLKNIGLMESHQMDKATIDLINQKKEAQKTIDNQDQPQSSFPANATLCHKCHQKSIIIMDGCATCLNCGYSKCS